MKNFGRLGLTAMLVLALVVASFAQGAGPKGGAGDQGGVQGKQKGDALHRAGKLHKELLAKLNLTPVQQKQIADLDARFQQQMQELKQAPGEKKEKAPRLREISQAHHQAVMKVLTPAQQKQLQDLIAEMRAKAGDRKGDKRNPPPTSDKAKRGKNPPPDKSKNPPPH
jgi:Spy/CpxP family protein refolding chaperone